MKHLESSFTGKNNFWRYIVMILLIFAATNSFGSLPFLIVSFLTTSSDPGSISNLSAGTGLLTNPGINENIMLMLILFPFIVGLAAFAFLIRPMHSRSTLMTFTGAGKIRWSHSLIAGSVWLVILAIYLFAYTGYDPGNFSLNNKSASIIILALVSIILIPFQAAFEELIFRGYLMQGFSRVVPSRLFPLVVTSLLFALMHSLNPEVKEFGFLTVMPQYLAFGLIFGIITILDDGIEAALGAHAANNIFLCIMVTQESSALQTNAVFRQLNYHPWVELIGLIVSGIILIAVLKKIFGWSDLTLIFTRVEREKPISQIP